MRLYSIDALQFTSHQLRNETTRQASKSREKLICLFDRSIEQQTHNTASVFKRCFQRPKRSLKFFHHFLKIQCKLAFLTPSKCFKILLYGHLGSAGFTYRLYRLKPRASRSNGASNKLWNAKSQLPVYDHLGWTWSKIYALIITHERYFHSTFVVITPESSNEFRWISIRRLVKPRANYCVDILKARWLHRAFAES